MTAWERLFPLFLRHNLIPEPVAVARLREAAKAELAQMEAQSSRASAARNVERWEAEKQRRTAELLTEIETARQSIANYPEWSPSAEDWKRLAIGLAIKHREPGFEFEMPPADRTAEQNWGRDNLVSTFMHRGDSVARATTATSKAIATMRGKGIDDYGKPVAAQSLEVGFAARNAARKAGRPVDTKHRSKQPQILEAYASLETHFLSILNDADSLTAAR